MANAIVVLHGVHIDLACRNLETGTKNKFIRHGLLTRDNIYE